MCVTVRVVFSEVVAFSPLTQKQECRREQSHAREACAVAGPSALCASLRAASLRPTSALPGEPALRIHSLVRRAPLARPLHGHERGYLPSPDASPSHALTSVPSLNAYPLRRSPLINGGWFPRTAMPTPQVRSYLTVRTCGSVGENRHGILGTYSGDGDGDNTLLQLYT